MFVFDSEIRSPEAPEEKDKVTKKNKQTCCGCHQLIVRW
jgi:hypothetical protein